MQLHALSKDTVGLIAFTQKFSANLSQKKSQPTPKKVCLCTRVGSADRSQRYPPLCLSGGEASGTSRSRSSRAEGVRVRWLPHQTRQAWKDSSAESSRHKPSRIPWRHGRPAPTQSLKHHHCAVGLDDRMIGFPFGIRCDKA